MTLKPVFCILFVFAIVLVVGCGSRSSDVERTRVSNPAQSTKSETPRRATGTTTKEVPLSGTNKITPTQVQIQLPKVLGQNSDEIRKLERRIDSLEKRVGDEKSPWGNTSFQLNPKTLQDDITKLERTVKQLQADVRDLEGDIRRLKR